MRKELLASSHGGSANAQSGSANDEASKKRKSAADQAKESDEIIEIKSDQEEADKE